MQKGSPKLYNWSGGVYRYACKEREVLAAVCECCEMCYCSVREEDEGECWDVLLEVAELVDAEGLVPADVDEDLDPAVEFEEGLGCTAGGLGAR